MGIQSCFHIETENARPARFKLRRECRTDFIEIRDGVDENSKLLGKYCGHHKPLDIKATGNQMYIKFTADGSVEESGFNVTFGKGKKVLKDFQSLKTATPDPNSTNRLNLNERRHVICHFDP